MKNRILLIAALLLSASVGYGVADLRLRVGYGIRFSATTSGTAIDVGIDTPAAGNGKTLNISAANGTASGNRNGGNLNLTAGTGNGSGTDGSVSVQPGGATSGGAVYICTDICDGGLLMGDGTNTVTINTRSNFVFGGANGVDVGGDGIINSIYYSGIAQTPSFSSTPAFDCNAGGLITMTLTNNLGVWGTFSAAKGPMQFCLLRLKQDGTGSRTIGTPPSNLKWMCGAYRCGIAGPNPTVPTLTTTANKADSFLFVSDASGNWLEVGEQYNQ